MPETILVVHIDPGPIPTFNISAPSLASAFAASAVAIFPAHIGIFFTFFLIFLM